MCGQFNFVVKYGIKLNEDPYLEGTKIDNTDVSEKKVELLKLHGSFNWFSMSKSDNADIDDIISVEQDDINEIFIDDDEEE